MMIRVKTDTPSRREMSYSEKKEQNEIRDTHSQQKRRVDELLSCDIVLQKVQHINKQHNLRICAFLRNVLIRGANQQRET